MVIPGLVRTIVTSGMDIKFYPTLTPQKPLYNFATVIANSVHQSGQQGEGSSLAWLR